MRAHVEGSYHRQHQEKIDVRSYFDAKEKDLINEAVQLVNATLVGALPESYLV